MHTTGSVWQGGNGNVKGNRVMCKFGIRSMQLDWSHSQFNIGNPLRKNEMNNPPVENERFTSFYYPVQDSELKQGKKTNRKEWGCYLYPFHPIYITSNLIQHTTFWKSQNYPHTDTAMNVGVAADEHSPEAAIAQWKFAVSRQYQHILDKTTPHVLRRWIGCLVVASVYVLRVYLVQGFYIVSYALGIYILNLLIGFLSPQVDPEINDGPTLPTRGSDEFRPFVRRLPEFKFWYSITKAFCIAFVMTFFSMFDVPVFWPILLFYWVVLFTLTMRRQISHMIKYKYVPFSFGKQRYNGKRTSPESTSLPVD
ncbi:hypothetical protein RJT34_05723 [Clitoria ternatea]|uniref:Protein RER1 n=1 Tax=Clitoria ternatea TaxID=43366 RepID=A0AAN9K4T8_CLITE